MNASRTAWFQWRLALNTPGIAFRHPLETQIDVSRPSNQPLEMQIAPDRRPRITLTMWDHPQSLRDGPSGPAVKDARPAGATLFARRPARLRLRTAPPAVRPTGGGTPTKHHVNAKGPPKRAFCTLRLFLNHSESRDSSEPSAESSAAGAASSDCTVCVSAVSAPSATSPLSAAPSSSPCTCAPVAL